MYVYTPSGAPLALCYICAEIFPRANKYKERPLYISQDHKSQLKYRACDILAAWLFVLLYYVLTQTTVEAPVVIKNKRVAVLWPRRIYLLAIALKAGYALCLFIGLQ
jgi:hypothetical protein